jgi:hypothetical protein
MKRETTDSDIEVEQKATKLTANYHRVYAEKLLSKEIFNLITIKISSRMVCIYNSYSRGPGLKPFSEIQLCRPRFLSPSSLFKDQVVYFNINTIQLFTDRPSSLRHAIRETESVVKQPI